MISGRHHTWHVPLLLAAAGLLIVVAWTGLWISQGASSTPTPTKTSAPHTNSTSPVDPAVESANSSSVVPVQSRSQTEEQALVPVSTPSSSPLPTWTSFPTPSAVRMAEPTQTPTPRPTFTPPRPDAPAANAWDHYWLERPIPPDFTNWSDRIYPYGSTQGRTLPTHHGVEFYNPAGVPVVAAGTGVVVTAGSDNEVLFGPQADYYGNLVVVRHEQLYQGQYLYTLYGHLSEVLAHEGQGVAAGDRIGSVGGTGAARGGAHLHFEVRVGDNYYESTRNPELWVRPFPGWGTLAGRLLWHEGSFVYEAPLLIRRADDPSRFVERSLYTYADDSVNPDNDWWENFTTPDLEPGPYEVIFRHEDIFRRELVWVYPGQTAFVTIQLEAVPQP